MPARHREIKTAYSLDFREKAVLLHVEGPSYYCLWRPDGCVYDLMGKEFELVFGDYLRIGAEEGKDLAVQLNSLCMSAQMLPTTPVHSLAFYDDYNGTLYVWDGGPGYWQRERGAKDSPSYNVGGWNYHWNGEAGVFFYTQGRAAKWTPDFSCPEAFEWFLSRFPFDEKQGLTRREQEALLEVWLVQQFFPVLRRSQCIPCFLGREGSGKSTACRTMGWLFTGPSFQVGEAREEDQRGFQATVVNSIMAGLDNVDMPVRWFESAICTYSTGVEYSTRAYYTTMSLVRYYPRAILLLASKSPHFRDPSVSQRLLQFYLCIPEGENRPPDSENFTKLMSYRDKIMGQLLIRAGRMADKLASPSSASSTFRMAEFDVFGQRYMHIYGRGAEWKELILKLAGVQAEFAGEGENIVIAVDQLLNERGGIVGPVDTVTLRKDLLHGESGEGLKWMKDARSFSRHLNAMAGIIENRCNCTVTIEKRGEKGCSTRQTMVTIVRKGQT